MDNKILLAHVSIGPTYRKRLLSNIINNIDNYLLFDNLILTDDINFFETLNKYSNIKIEYINDIRKNFEWSIKYESIPIKTNNEEEYANYVVNNLFKMPSGLFRFSFLKENIEEYDLIVCMNCDIICKINKEIYNNIIENLSEYGHDFVIGNHGFTWDNFKTELDIISSKFNISYDDINLNTNDGNLFMYHFKNKSKIKKFLELYNNIVYETLVEGNQELYRLGNHASWGLNSEAIQAILHTLLDIKVYPNNSTFREGFQINTYPEDRFWNWPTGGFKTNTVSKELFIQENKELLKEFYKYRGQTWQYN